MVNVPGATHAMAFCLHVTFKAVLTPFYRFCIICVLLFILYTVKQLNKSQKGLFQTKSLSEYTRSKQKQLFFLKRFKYQKLCMLRELTLFCVFGFEFSFYSYSTKSDNLFLKTNVSL